MGVDNRGRLRKRSIQRSNGGGIHKALSVCAVVLLFGCAGAEPTEPTNETGPTRQDGFVDTSILEPTTTLDPSTRSPDATETTGSLDHFLAAWNAASTAQGRPDWYIQPRSRYDQQAPTSGIHATLGSDETVTVDITATGDEIAKLELAVPKSQQAMGDLISDAFTVAVTASQWDVQDPNADGFVAELLEQSRSPDPASSAPIRLSNDGFAQSFATESLQVLVVTWAPGDG